MTQQEFTERTNFWPTAEQFETINEAYMATDIDKDTFCKRWKKENLLSYSRSNVIKMAAQQRQIEFLEKDNKRLELEYWKAVNELETLKKQLNQVKEIIG
jgi:predicted RNase H-like nuclease (RuvC/YqgF family)